MFKTWNIQCYHFRIVDNAANDIFQYICYFFHIPHQIFSLIKLHINSKFILTGICSNSQVVEWFFFRVVLTDREWQCRFLIVITIIFKSKDWLEQILSKHTSILNFRQRTIIPFICFTCLSLKRLQWLSYIMTFFNGYTNRYRINEQSHHIFYTLSRSITTWNNLNEYRIISMIICIKCKTPCQFQYGIRSDLFFRTKVHQTSHVVTLDLHSQSVVGLFFFRNSFHQWNNSSGWIILQQIIPICKSLFHIFGTDLANIGFVTSIVTCIRFWFNTLHSFYKITQQIGSKQLNTPSINNNMMNRENQLTCIVRCFYTSNAEQGILLQIKSSFLFSQVNFSYSLFNILFFSDIPHFKTKRTIHNGLTIVFYTLINNRCTKNLMFCP